MRKFIFMSIALAGLSACAANPAPVETVYQPVPYPVPAPCPAKEVYDDVAASKPVPLREQPMPATAIERNAKAQAQIGRYEAPGAWVDKVWAVVNRCYHIAPVTAESDVLGVDSPD